MSSIFFSSSSKSSKQVESEQVIDYGKLRNVLNFLENDAENEDFNIKEKHTFLELTKVTKNDENSKLENIKQCKKFFEDKIDELFAKINPLTPNDILVKDKRKHNLTMLIIAFYNYFDNIEGDNNKTLLGDAAPLSTNNALKNFIKACNILENLNPKINPMVATVDIADNDLSASNSEYNDLASSVSHINLAQSTETDEIPYAKPAINYEAKTVIVAQEVKDTSEISTVINKYKNISDYATFSIFGNLEKNALNIYLQRYRAFPILDAMHEILDPENGRFHSRTVYWNDYQFMDNQNFSKHIPILNLLGSILIVNYSIIESLMHEEDESKRNMRWGKIKQEIKELQEYVKTANLIPEKISYLHIGIPPKKSWMDPHYENVLENPDFFAKTTCEQAYKEIMKWSNLFIDKSNKQFLEEILPAIINGKKPEIESKRKSSIFKRLMGE